MFTGSISFIVLGADFKTGRAAGRKAEISIIFPGDTLTLKRDRGMIGGRPAVGVYSSRGRQIGYIQPHEVGMILPDVDRAQAIFQSAETFGAVARITLDGSKPTLPQPKPKPQIIHPPHPPRDEYCSIFPLKNQSKISRPAPSDTDIRTIPTKSASPQGSVGEQIV